MASIKWPDWVWVGLTAANFCSGTNTKGSGAQAKHDLQGWVKECFPDTFAYDEAVRALEKHTKGKGLISFADADKTTLAMQATVWNKTMRELGYTAAYTEKPKATCKKS